MGIDSVLGRGSALLGAAGSLMDLKGGEQLAGVPIGWAYFNDCFVQMVSSRAYFIRSLVSISTERTPK